MRLIKQTELATMLGLTRQAISKAIKNGMLRQIKTGMDKKQNRIDLHDSKTMKYIESNSKNRDDAIHKKNRKNKVKSYEESEPEDENDSDDIPAMEQITIPVEKQSIINTNSFSLPKGKLTKEEFESEVESSDYWDQKQSIDIQKIKSSKRQIDLNIAVTLKDLISRKTVENVFSKMCAAILNYFLPLGDRLAPIIAGMLGVTDKEMILRIKDLIDNEVTRSLGEFKKVCNEKINDGE